jgi:hypothetical protein
MTECELILQVAHLQVCVYVCMYVRMCMYIHVLILSRNEVRRNDGMRNYLAGSASAGMCVCVYVCVCVCANIHTFEAYIT